MGELEQRLEVDVQAAARARAPELVTLRLVKAALHNEVIARRRPLGEAEVVAVLRRELKKRREAAVLYQQGGRSELAQSETAEATVIERYLPPAPSAEAVAAKALELASELKLEGPGGLGPLVKALAAHYGGAVDGAAASAAARQALGLGS